MKRRSGIEIKDLENGFYWFCLDHSRVFGEEEITRVTFHIKNKDDLLRRVYARATGIYQVKDEKDIEKAHQKLFEKNRKMRHWEKINKERDEKIKKLPRFKREVISLLRKLRNCLIDKWID